MRRDLSDSPIAQAAILVAIYLAASAAMFVADFLLFPEIEFIEIAWLRWVLLFGPAILTTIVSGVGVAVEWRRLKVLYAVSVVAVLLTMETVSLMNPGLGTALVVVVVLCIAIVGLFRWYGAAPSERGFGR